MITRFAPSPTGPLHLGHAYSAMLAYDMAMAVNGTFLLRIEDIDTSRSRPQWEAQIYDDLRWLGLWWPEPVMRQSERLTAYTTAIENLWKAALLYPCRCTRKDIEQAASAPQEGAVIGPDGIVYPGTCAGSVLSNTADPCPLHMPLRLKMAKAAELVGGHDGTIAFQERLNAPMGAVVVSDKKLTTTVGDVVIARRDMGTSYHLSVVIDDAAQGITDVVRGADLFEATQIHIILQKILDLAMPTYHHHRLIRDDDGKRLAKRDDARALSKYRAEGATPNDIRRMVGLPEA